MHHADENPGGKKETPRERERERERERGRGGSRSQAVRCTVQDVKEDDRTHEGVVIKRRE